jgi:caa(3)-type oxidase subunit IV
MIGIRLVTLITAFGIAIVKAYLVTKHFMHLNIEKRWVTWILVAMIAFMVVMFGGVAPDVMKHTGHHWDKDYVEPALVHEEHGE